MVTGWRGSRLHIPWLGISSHGVRIGSNLALDVRCGLLWIAGPAIEEQSRRPSGSFWRPSPEHTVKVFDVNLRQAYYSAEVLAESMRLADIVKFNDEELPKIMGLMKVVHKDERRFGSQAATRIWIEGGLHHAGGPGQPAGAGR